MNDSSNSLPPSGDDALEARIVAWVLGEASPFEAAELEKLCAGDPKLRDYERRTRDLHEILVADAKPGMHAAWKLPAGKREKITDLLGAVAEAPADGKVNRYFARRILLAAAACVAISLVSYPLFSGARKEVKVAMSPEKSVDFIPAGGGQPRGESLELRPRLSTSSREKKDQVLEGKLAEVDRVSGRRSRDTAVPELNVELSLSDADESLAANDAPVPAAPSVMPPQAMPADREMLAKNDAAGAAAENKSSDPADLYFKGWLDTKDAEKLKERGDEVAAKSKLAAAQEKFERVKEEHPEWKKQMAGGRLQQTEDQLAQLGALPELKEADVSDFVTGGLRSGDGAINRNNIDAILNNPDSTPVPGQRSVVAGVELQLPAEQVAGAAPGNEPAMVLRDKDPSVSRFSLDEIVPRKPGEMPIQDSRAKDGYARDDKPSDLAWTNPDDPAAAGGDRMAWSVTPGTSLGFRDASVGYDSAAGRQTAAGGNAQAVAAAEKFFFGSSAPSVSGFIEADGGTTEPRPLMLGGMLHSREPSGGASAGLDPRVTPATPPEMAGEKTEAGTSSDDYDQERAKLLAQVDAAGETSVPPGPADRPKSAEDVDGVRRSLYLGEGAYKLGKYDDAFRAYEDVIRVDPYNKAARRGMEQVAQAKTDYYRAAYDHTRAELLSQVDSVWELQVPPVLPTAPAEGTKAETGLSALAEKEVARRQSTVAEADRFVEEGKKAQASGDLEKAYKMQVDGLGLLPEAPAVDTRRAEVKRSLGEIAAGLAVDAKAKGNQDAAKEWAGKALQWNSEQKEAKQILDLGGGDETSAVAEPFSTFSLHVSDASFKLAKAALDRGEQPDPAGIRAEEFYNAFDYGDPAPAQGEPVVCVTEQAAHPILPQRNLVRIGVRTAAAGRGGSTPLNLTLLLDSSGSMEREDRQAAMLRAVEQLSGLLKEGDTITVAGFARQPHLLADRLPGARAQELNQIIARTPSEGGTNLEEGLKLAEELAKRQFNAAAQNRVVLFTDGAANLGDAQPESLQARVEQLRQQGIAFDAAGFGADGLNDRLLERLTRNGNGRYYVVDRAEDAGEGFAKQLAGAFRPAAENVKVQVRFNPARVARYKLIGFEEHRLAKEDFKNDAVDAAEMAAEEAGNALYQIEPIPGGEGEIGEVSVRFRDVASGQMVERTWTIPYETQVPAFDQAAPSMQLAGLAMFAAEKLRKAPMAEAIDFGQLGKALAPVKTRYAGSAVVAELGEMIERLK